MDQQLIDLYHRHVGMGFDRQLRLADYLERKAPGAGWAYDVPTATLSFGPKLTFEAPLVGSHADHNNSWLWAWSNRNLRLTLTNRALGDTVRALGHRHGIGAFSMVGMPLEPLIGPELAGHAAHVLGVVLAGELGYDAYYLAPYEGGRAVVLVRDDRLKFAERSPLARVLTVYPQLISALPVFDHRVALTHYAREYGLAVTEENGRVKLTTGKKDHITATFDERGRLTNLDGTVAPLQPAAKKPTISVSRTPAAKKPAAGKPVGKTAKPKPVASKAATKKPAKPGKPAVKATGSKPKPATKAKPTAGKPAKKPLKKVLEATLGKTVRTILKAAKVVAGRRPAKAPAKKASKKR